MSPGDLWIICQNLSVLKYQAAARFGRQFNCTGDFSKHLYESTCKKADHRTDTGEFSACRL